jgi:hypothetical protein
MRIAELLDAFEADDPGVHRPEYRELEAHEVASDEWARGSGTFTTDRSCYEFLAESVGSGSVTLETGLGLSTLIFALSGCDHTAMFLDSFEEDRVRGWATGHGIDLGSVRFVVGPSDASLRAAEQTPIDLFLIDGGHGYPLPQLDWFYGASRLRAGGVLVIDDLQLWAPSQLNIFLDLDPRWERADETKHHRKWSAYRRLVDGPVAEDFDAQGFLARSTTHMNWKGRLVHALPDPVRRRVLSVIQVDR